MRIKNLCLLICLTGSTQLSAVESDPIHDRVSLNWDTMRIRFYGEAQRKESAKTSEESAIKEGLSYIVEALPSIRMATLEGQYLGEEFAKSIAMNVSRRTANRKTTYYTDGRVRVELESSLAQALAPEGLKLAKEAPNTELNGATGLVVLLDAPMDPQMIFEIQDEDGDSVYRLKDVASSEFEKTFMGRFFKSASSRSLKYFVGDKPLKIKGKLKGDRTIVVSEDEWDDLVDDHYGILERARVAVVSR